MQSHHSGQGSSSDQHLLQHRPHELGEGTFSLEDLLRTGGEASDLHERQIEGQQFSQAPSLARGGRRGHNRTLSSTSVSTDFDTPQSGGPDQFPTHAMNLSFNSNGVGILNPSSQSIAGTQANRILEDVPERGRSKSSTRGVNNRSKARKNTSSVSASREREKTLGKGRSVERKSGRKASKVEEEDEPEIEDEQDEDEEEEEEEEKPVKAAKKKAAPKAPRSRIVIDTTGMSEKEAEEAKQ